MAARESGEGRVPLTAGEVPRVAFISSVMDAELEEVRRRVVAAMQKAPFLLPWAFEMTPASSGEPVAEYLRKVREATFVLWFPAGRTTAPVEAEVSAAVAASRRLLVFLLPSSDRDQATTDLLKKVRDHCRYRELESLDRLEEEVEAAIADELARALDGQPSVSRAERIDALGRASRARCIQKWQAAGLGRGLAGELADDVAVGAATPEFLPGSDRPLVVLVGEAGRGKSLACERFLQSAIATARDDGTAPTPVFLAAMEATGDVRGTLAKACTGLADPGAYGARVVIDGADETGERSALLLAEARELVSSEPDTQVIISSRPMPVFEEIEETVAMPELSERRALETATLAAGRQVTHGEYMGWAEPLRDAAKVPLFALLIGERLRRGEDLVRSRAELLAALADLSIGPQSGDARAVLRRLAVLSIRRGGAKVPISELGGPEIAKTLEGSRLVVSNGGEASFPLALTAQWLAAESLAEDEPSPAELARSAEDLELWRYPLAMLVGSFSDNEVTKVLAPLVREHPGFVSQIVDESLARWGKSTAAIPSPAEAGPRMREAMANWLVGLGELADLVVPGYERDSRRLPPLGVTEERSHHLVAGWYVGEESIGDIVRLPIELFYQGSGNPAEHGWPRMRSFRPPPQAAWVWHWCQEEIRIALERTLGERALRIAGGGLEEPRLWLASLAVLGLAETYSQPLPVERVRTRATELLPEADPNLRGYGSHAIDLGRLIEILDRYAVEGRETVDPSPLEVEPSGRLYLTPAGVREAELGRVAAIYEAALGIYGELATSLFSGLAPFMPLAATLPAQLDLHLYSRGPDPSPPEGIEWAFYALPFGESSRVELSATLEGGPEAVDQWRQDWVAGADEAGEALRRLRPEQRRWISLRLESTLTPSLGHLAVEEIVYGWLWGDLRHLRLIGPGQLPECAYKVIP